MSERWFSRAPRSYVLPALTALMVLPTVASAQDWRTFTSSRATNREEQLRVDLEYGAGRLDLAPAPSGTLYRTNLRYDAEAFQPRVIFQNGRLRVGVEGREVKGKIKSGHLDLKLAADVPLDLDLKFGAAEANIELGGMRIQRGQISTGASKTVLRVSKPNQERCQLFDLNIGAASFHASGLGNLNAELISLEGGVGEVILNFAGAWRADSRATVQMGLGSLTLQIPRGLGLRVVKEGFLASFDSEGLIKRGNAFYSENWENAKHKLSLDIEAAFGSIKVVWVE